MLPASGQIAMDQVNTELGLAYNTQISLGQASVRTLAGIPSGQIDMNTLHGKSNTSQHIIERGAGGYTGDAAYWNSPTGVYTSGGSSADINIGVYGYKSFTANTFGFTLPAGAVIDGFQVILRHSGYSDTVTDLVTPSIGTQKNIWTPWEAVFSNEYFGGATDKWGATPTAANMNAFAVTLRIYNNSGSVVPAYLDYIGLKVWATY